MIFYEVIFVIRRARCFINWAGVLLIDIEIFLNEIVVLKIEEKVLLNKIIILYCDVIILKNVATVLIIEVVVLLNEAIVLLIMKTSCLFLDSSLVWVYLKIDLLVSGSLERKTSYLFVFCGCGSEDGFDIFFHAQCDIYQS